MREMRKNVAVIEASHGDFRNNHLKECRKSREDTEFIRGESKTSRSGEVAAFHDTRRNENLGVLLVDNFQASRTLEITYAYKVSNIVEYDRKKQTHCQLP